MSSGKPKVQNYDPSEDDAKLQMEKTKIQDETSVRAYGAAKDANTMRDINVGLLRDGIGFMSDILDNGIKQSKVNREQATLKNVEDQQVAANAAMSQSKMTSDLLDEQVKLLREGMDSGNYGSDLGGLLSRVSSGRVKPTQPRSIKQRPEQTLYGG